MRILLDHGAPRGLAKAISGHEVDTAKSQGWESRANGDLLTEAEQNGYDVLITTDQSIPHQQNFRDRQIGLVILTNTDWKEIRKKIGEIESAIRRSAGGKIEKITVPRRR